MPHLDLETKHEGNSVRNTILQHERFTNRENTFDKDFLNEEGKVQRQPRTDKIDLYPQTTKSHLRGRY